MNSVWKFLSSFNSAATSKRSGRGCKPRPALSKLLCGEYQVGCSGYKLPFTIMSARYSSPTTNVPTPPNDRSSGNSYQGLNAPSRNAWIRAISASMRLITISSGGEFLFRLRCTLIFSVSSFIAFARAVLGATL